MCGLSIFVGHTVLAHAVSFFVPHFGSADPAAPRTLVTKVERVSDGDTVIAVTSNQTKLSIRLLGIDAPEVLHGTKPGQPFP